MRHYIPTLLLTILSFGYSWSNNQYLVWSSSPNALSFSDEAQGELILEGEDNLYRLTVSSPDRIKIENKSTQNVKVKVLWLNNKQGSDWVDIKPAASLNLREVLDNMVVRQSALPLWDAVTDFLTKCHFQTMPAPQDAAKQLADRIGIREVAQAQKFDAINFKTDKWLVYNGPEDLDISWNSKYPIKKVEVRNLSNNNVVLLVEDLGYYRVHYPGLDPEIQEKLERDRKYELFVTVMDEKGQEQISSVRFFIKKSLLFNQFVSKEFAKDQFHFNWESHYLVTEVSFIKPDSKDTLYHTKDLDVIKQFLKEPLGKGGIYEINQNVIEREIPVERGNEYNLVIAISDEIGAKRLFSKRFYCMSMEESIVAALGDDRENYRSLLNYVDDVKEVRKTEPVVPSSPTRASKVKEKKGKNDQPKGSNPEEKFVERSVKGFTPPASKYHYSFDDLMVYDRSGNRYDLGNLLGPDRNGKANSAYKFDGEKDYFSLPASKTVNITEQKPFSIAFWYKSSEQSGTLLQVFNQNSTEGDLFLNIEVKNNQPEIRICAENVTCEMLFGKPISQTAWHHIALVLNDERELQLFVDGINVRSRSLNLDAKSYNNYNFVFGKDRSENNFFKGHIDDIYLFEKALSKEELYSLLR